MNDTLTLLLWCGGVGWFLLSFLLTLGRSRSAASALVWTACYWLVGMDLIAMSISGINAVIEKRGFGWRFVAVFVVLPYGLGFLRASWFWRRRLTPSPPAAHTADFAVSAADPSPPSAPSTAASSPSRRSGTR